jgi:DNA-binding protein YbaB
MSGYEAEFEELMGRYRRKLAELIGLQRRVAESSTTAESTGHSVRVTVNGQGEITALEFPTGAYRLMSAAELSEEILSTARDALAKAREPVRALLKPGLLHDAGLLEPSRNQADPAAPGPAES